MRLSTPVTQLSFSSVEEADFEPDGALEIPAFIEDKTLELLRQSAAKNSVEIAALNGTFNMAHPDRRIRLEGLRRLELLARAANALGCRMITLCSGTRNTVSLWAPHPKNGSAAAWGDMFETIAAAVETAKKHGITLAVETEAGNIIDTPEKARKLMDDVGSPNLKMIMDCANLFHAGEAKAANVRSVMKHAFDLFGDDVVIAHGKDIRESGGIEFCPAGEGIIDYGYFARLLREHGYRGDLFLHGVYDEEKLPAALELLKTAAGV